MRQDTSGTYICHRGDRFDYWTGVVTGLVKKSAISASGKAITFAGAGAGSWFGEGTVSGKVKWTFGPYVDAYFWRFRIFCPECPGK